MSVKIVYKDIAVGADEDAQVSSTNAADFSNLQLLPFGVEPKPVATLEVDQWSLDGTRKTRESQTLGFWSTTLSGEDGKFTSPPSIKVIFDEQYTSLGVTLRFDTSTGDYCDMVTVVWMKADTVLDTKTFYPDNASYFCENTVVAYDSVEFTFHSTNVPYRFAKVTQILFGVERTFDLDELRNVKATQEVNVTSSEVAINTLDFTLDSRSNVEYMFQLKQPVLAYNGQLLIGTYYISSSSRSAQNLYSVSCEDAIGVLDEETIPAAMYTGYSVKTALEEVIGGHFPLELDDEYITSTLNGYIPSCTRREALQQVAFSLMAIVDTSGTNSIRVFKPNLNDPKEIPTSRIYTGGSVETDAIVTAVKVTAHSYATSGSGDDTVEVNGTKYYHNTQVITINNPDVTATDKQNVIEVTDATLVNMENVQQVAQYLYDYYMRRNRQSIKIVVDQERPGDYVKTTSPWMTNITGHITRMDLTLSGIAAADCEVIGE